MAKTIVAQCKPCNPVERQRSDAGEPRLRVLFGSGRFDACLPCPLQLVRRFVSSFPESMARNFGAHITSRPLRCWAQGWLSVHRSLESVLHCLRWTLLSDPLIGSTRCSTLQQARRAISFYRLLQQMDCLSQLSTPAISQGVHAIHAASQSRRNSSIRNTPNICTRPCHVTPVGYYLCSTTTLILDTVVPSDVRFLTPTTFNPDFCLLLFISLLAPLIEQ